MENICAISTKLGSSAINIVRISGDDAIDIINNLVEVDLNKIKQRVLTKIHDKQGKLIDEVIVSIFRAPKSFTTENLVEVSCHGGVIAAKLILDVMLQANNTRLAQPGEFTKRAFLNGRIDANQVQAISSILNAQTELSHRAAINQLSGAMNQFIEEIKDKIFKLIASIEIAIDYPEYDDVTKYTNEYILQEVQKISDRFQTLIQRIDNGKVIQEGINTLIVGKPNVGKSTLLNAMTNNDTAIVSDVEGTTRDIIQERVKIDHLILNLVDTAGIRQTSNKVEKIGIDKAIKNIEISDLIIFVVDVSKPLTQTDFEIYDMIKNKKHIIVLNKSDLGQEVTTTSFFVNSQTITMNNKTPKLITSLTNVINEMFLSGQISENEFYFVNQIAQKNTLRECQILLNELINQISDQMLFEDLIVQDLRVIYDEIGKVNNTRKDDEIINRMFSEYCLGK